MQSNHVQYSAARRANDDFLRQLVGGELCRTEKNHTQGGEKNHTHSHHNHTCNHPYNRPEPRGAICNLQTRREEQSNPSCNQGDGCGVPTSHIHAPALAMVYSPAQGWEGLLDPVQALSHGCQFTALILPLEVDEHDGNCGRCQK